MSDKRSPSDDEIRRLIEGIRPFTQSRAGSGGLVGHFATSQGDAGGVGDVEQELHLKFWRKNRRSPGFYAKLMSLDEKKRRAFVIKSMDRCIKDLLKSTRRRQRRERQEPELEGRYDALGEYIPEPDRWTEEDANRLVENVLPSLPREAVVLLEAIVLGIPQKELAEKYRVSDRSIRRWIENGTEALRDALQRKMAEQFEPEAVRGLFEALRFSTISRMSATRVRGRRSTV